MCSLLQLFINFDILAHFFPFSLISAIRMLSSSSVHPYFFYFRRQVAIPSLSASRRVNEQRPVTGEVHVHTDALPIFLSLLFNQLQQLCVIVLSPIVAFLVFDDTQTLMFQEERILIEEALGNGPPLSFALHRPIITISAGVKLLIMQ